jgi:hypothetical protein
MEVRDLFRFADGRTVFVGSTDAPESVLISASCDLLVDGEVVERFDVSEELPERRASSPREERSVSTDSEVRITAQTVNDCDVRLRQRAG